MSPRPQLAKQHRLSEFDPDQKRDNCDHGRQQDHGRGRYDKVEQALHASSISWSICALILSTSNLLSAISRERRPIRLIRFGSSRNRCSASTKGSTVRGGTRNPFSPSVTVSRQPGASVVMIGRPIAIASSTLRGVPSR